MNPNESLDLNRQTSSTANQYPGNPSWAPQAFTPTSGGMPLGGGSYAGSAAPSGVSLLAGAPMAVMDHPHSSMSQWAGPPFMTNAWPYGQPPAPHVAYFIYNPNAPTASAMPMSGVQIPPFQQFGSHPGHPFGTWLASSCPSLPSDAPAFSAPPSITGTEMDRLASKRGTSPQPEDAKRAGKRCRNDASHSGSHSAQVTVPKDSSRTLNPTEASRAPATYEEIIETLDGLLERYRTKTSGGRQMVLNHLGLVKSAIESYANKTQSKSRRTPFSRFPIAHVVRDAYLQLV